MNDSISKNLDFLLDEMTISIGYANVFKLMHWHILYTIFDREIIGMYW